MSDLSTFGEKGIGVPITFGLKHASHWRDVMNVVEHCLVLRADKDLPEGTPYEIHFAPPYIPGDYERAQCGQLYYYHHPAMIDDPLGWIDKVEPEAFFHERPFTLIQRRISGKAPYRRSEKAAA